MCVCVCVCVCVFIQIEEIDEEEEEEADVEAIPEAQEQEAAEFGWFNDLYVLDTGIRVSQCVIILIELIILMHQRSLNLPRKGVRDADSHICTHTRTNIRTGL